MKMLFYRAFVAALALLSGCIAYYGGSNEPKDALLEGARSGCNPRPRCLLELETRVSLPEGPFGEPPLAYCQHSKDALIGLCKNSMFDAIQESGVFRSCVKRAGKEIVPGDVSIKASCDFFSEETVASGLLTIFTLTLFPGDFHAYRFNFEFVVTDGYGHEALYRSKEIIYCKFGLGAAVMAPFITCDSEAVLAEMYRKVMNNLFVKMQKDAFFSAEGRDKAAAAKADVVEAAKKTVAARRKELEDLKKAGVITEDEYRKEIEGVVK